MKILNMAADLLGLPYRIGFAVWKFSVTRGRRPHIPAYTISVGNLTVGGSGKTPFVIELARELHQRGVKLAVLSRGYMRKSRGMVVAEPGSDVNPELIGDEPALIFRKLNGRVPVIVHRDRLKAGRYAVENFDVEAVILDDGFQQLKLLHDYVILLINLNDLNGGPLLPFGRFREPISAVERADLVVVNYRNKEFDDREFDFGITPYIRMRHTVNVPVDAGTKAFAFAGIAHPSEFLEALRSHGIEVVGFKRFRDHRWYSRRDIEKIVKKAKLLGADVILTTEKDFVRLIEPPPEILPVELKPEIEGIDHIASILKTKM